MNVTGSKALGLGVALKPKLQCDHAFLADGGLRIKSGQWQKISTGQGKRFRVLIGSRSQGSGL